MVDIEAIMKAEAHRKNAGLRIERQLQQISNQLDQLIKLIKSQNHDGEN
jgi:hypothetical protein